MPLVRAFARTSSIGGLVAMASIGLAGCGATSFPEGSGTSALTNPNSITVDIVGTIGSQAVRFTATPTRRNPNVVVFQGTVGPHHVTGTVQPFQAHGADHEATATFTVTG